MSTRARRTAAQPRLAVSRSRRSPRPRARGSAATDASWRPSWSAIRRAWSAACVEEVLQAALGVVGQRVDARDVLLRAGDAHRRPALGQRPGAADGGRRRSAARAPRARRAGAGAPAGGRRARRGGRRRTRDRASSSSGSRHTASTVSAATSASRSARRLLGVEPLGLVAVGGLGRGRGRTGRAAARRRATAAPAPRPPCAT